VIRGCWARLRRALRPRRVFKWVCLAAVTALLLLLTPVAYIELACRGEGETIGRPAYQPRIADGNFLRREANTYLTYPEWHIVYAYDGLAAALKTGDEYRFDYLPSVARFWRSTCSLTKIAGAHGGADWNTRAMIHTIGVSFTVEMLAKAAYEETIGRAAAWVRGPRKTPQDEAIARMATDYAAFLRQTPWYRYPFDREVHTLWAQPVSGVVRGWERRLGMGFEFLIKVGYAKMIEGAVAATAPAQLEIRSVVAGLDTATLASIAGVKVIGPRGDGIEIETPRYDRFTRILVEIAHRGGDIREIAGNDEIMVSLTVPANDTAPIQHGNVILRMTRDTIPGARVLVNVAMSDLAAFLNTYPLGDPGLEHVFDY
jgi:hypothetical protein